MRNFVVGDRVICVNDSSMQPVLRNGVEYILREVTGNSVNVAGDYTAGAFSSSRFVLAEKNEFLLVIDHEKYVYDSEDALLADIKNMTNGAENEVSIYRLVKRLEKTVTWK